MKEYNHKKIEKKWQKIWEQKKIFQAKNPAKDGASSSKNPKFYALIEFPYPSGAGMHVGHIRSNTAMDIISRKRRMEGFNVLYPIGWDAFGLPTENYAIKTGIHPIKVTKNNTDVFRRQLKALGFSFDWSREINTTDPKYYKWTQWIFLQFFKKGLAYKKKMAINWCPKDKIGLANEEVADGKCERCGTVVEKREKEQWMLAITKYADRLDKDLDTVNFLEKIKIQQRNWIGKSEGAEIEFCVSQDLTQKINIFTTRPDTIFGATYLVLAPEHKLVYELKSEIKNWKEVEGYIEKVKNKTEVERTSEDKEKTGIELKGIKAINPANNEEMPVWIADYVLVYYGTGAIMAVPAHDERDFKFAKKYNIPYREVVIPKVIDKSNPPLLDKKTVERNAIQAIVINPTNNKIICLKWKKFPWTTFVVGGIEDGENMIDAGKREILEETGYKNLKYIKTLGGQIESNFYAAHKGVNRKALFSVLVFELKDEEKLEISDVEKEIHNVCWVTWEELKKDKNVRCAEYEIILDRFFNPPHSYRDSGVLINSGKFSGLDSEKAKKEIIKFVGGREKTTFRLRDWIFSRQRYWGEPIPVINCEKCGLVPVPEKDLPVELPKVKNYQPTDSGESPLSNIKSFVNTRCPLCKGKAKRETDTMPNWAGSSWYYLRYMDPKNNKEFASQRNLKYWTPVDWYNGGMEHTTLHLLYSRFWHKFLYDLKLVPTSEPYMKRTSHGMILAYDGTKFSKSKGNGIDPEDIVKIYGADSLRLYQMFMGPFDQSVSWSSDGMVGPRRFIEKVWRIGEKVVSSSESSFAGSLSPLASGALTLGSSACERPRKGNSATLTKLLHKTIKKVSEDIEEMRFNTAISALMILATEMESAFAKGFGVTREDYKLFLQILSPFAPHVAEELWSMLGEKKSINFSSWPKWDESLIKDEEIKIVVQVNGKVRTEMLIDSSDQEENIKKQALNNEIVLKHTTGRDIKKIIYVKNRLINIVV